jgi:hypothetical protein|tara:strand:+ start:271 stop:501 length:231 start_codon:yes stop_codon:yes gene_type:complete
MKKYMVTVRGMKPVMSFPVTAKDKKSAAKQVHKWITPLFKKASIDKITLTVLPARENEMFLFNKDEIGWEFIGIHK